MEPPNSRVQELTTTNLEERSIGYETMTTLSDQDSEVRKTINIVLKQITISFLDLSNHTNVV